MNNQSEKTNKHIPEITFTTKDLSTEEISESNYFGEKHLLSG